MYLNLLAPIISLAINASLQIGLYLLASKIGLLKSVILGFIGGFAALLFNILLQLFYFENSVLAIIDGSIVNLMTYFLLSYGYFVFINLGETARRIRLVRELYDKPEGLNLNEIFDVYNAHTVVELRLNRLLDNHQIVQRDGKYFIGKSTMLLLDKILIVLKLLILGKKSEFD